MKEIKKYVVRIGFHPPFVIEAKDLKDAYKKARYYKYIWNISGQPKVNHIKP